MRSESNCPLRCEWSESGDPDCYATRVNKVHVQKYRDQWGSCRLERFECMSLILKRLSVDGQCLRALLDGLRFVIVGFIFLY